MRVALAMMAIFALVQSAGAAELENFDNGSYSGPGTVVADPSGTENSCLFLDMAGSDVPDVFAIDISSLEDAGTIGLDIYDCGKVVDTHNADGPRWGVKGALNTLAVGICHRRSAFDCRHGYAINSTALAAQNDDILRSEMWNVTILLSEPREVAVLDTDLSASVSGAEGKWSRWLFSVSDEKIVTQIQVDDKVVYDQSSGLAGIFSASLGQLEQLWVSAGQASFAGLEGVYVDNVFIQKDEAEKLPGDADGNGSVDIFDFLILKNHYGSSPADWSNGDFDGDSDVDVMDFLVLKGSYGLSVQ